MTPNITPASSVATTHGTHDLKTAGRASTTAATETPRFSAKIVAIHSLYTPAREPKPTSTRPIKISTHRRTRAAVRSAARSAAARTARTSSGRAFRFWRQARSMAASPGCRGIDNSISLGRRWKPRDLFRQRGRRGQLDLIAALQCLGRAVDHPIRGGKPGDDLDTVSEVAAELDGLEHRLAVVAEKGDLRAAVSRHQRRRRDAYHVRIVRQLEMHLAIGAREQLAVGIVGLQLDQHAARAQLHRIRCRDHLCIELLAGILRHLG